MKIQHYEEEEFEIHTLGIINPFHLMSEPSVYNPQQFT